MATYQGQALPNGNVLLIDKESNNPSHMIDTLMCVWMLRLVDHMVCAYAKNFITMIRILTQVKQFASQRTVTSNLLAI